VLERNDIGTAVVPVILMYVYQMTQGKENRGLYLRRTLVMTAILILCGKRSAMVALAVAMLVLWLLSLNLKNKFKVCSWLCVGTIGMLYAFVATIKSGLLEWLCLKAGISTQGRIFVWTWFSDQYDLSPLYLGKGFQYVHKYMQANIAEGGTPISMVSMFGYLHNSDLQIFIELGFVGFFLWFGFYLVVYPNNLRKVFGMNTYYLCVIMMICNVWMYMTDNTLTYPVYQSTLYVALFSYALREKTQQSTKKRSGRRA
jgi:O-antigen ligase